MHPLRARRGLEHDRGSPNLVLKRDKLTSQSSYWSNSSLLAPPQEVGDDQLLPGWRINLCPWLHNISFIFSVQRGHPPLRPWEQLRSPWFCWEWSRFALCSFGICAQKDLRR
jgi:hypothetical protein